MNDCNVSKTRNFLMLIIYNKNSVFYVQRQINHIFWKTRHFVKAFINDIVIKSKFFNEHFVHFRNVFRIFSRFNIFIKSTKVLFNYLNLIHLRQKVNALSLFITKGKLKTIAKFKFSITLKNLKHYLNLTDYIRDQI